MRVVTWNMGMAGRVPSRARVHDQAWHYLLGLGPDLALVQEALPPRWVRTEGTLVHGPFTQWGSAIFSPRYPLERVSPPAGSALRALGSYLAVARASLPDGSDALVASVHAVDRKATKEQLAGLPSRIARTSAGHPWVSDVVFAGLEGLIGERPFLVAGDWNTARRFGRSQTSKQALEFFERARSHGWFECVDENPGVEMRTWFREDDEPSQIDHAFSDRTLHQRFRGAWVAAEAAEPLGLSDHAPLVLDFDVPPIAMRGLEGRSRGR